MVLRKTGYFRILLFLFLIIIILFTGLSLITSRVIAQSVNISASSGGRGKTITVSGSGFPVTTDYNITIGGISAGTGKTDGSGHFNQTVTIPDSLPFGTTTISVTAGDSSDQAHFEILSPIIRVSPDTGPVGSTITITGQYFKPLSSYTISFKGSNAGSGTTDGNGNFSKNVAVPSNASRGENDISATSDEDSATTTFIVPTPEIIPSPTGGVPGLKISLAGHYFIPNTGYEIYFDNVKISSGTINASGNLSTTFTVPSVTSSGNKILTVKTSIDSVTETFIIPTPGLTLSPQTGGMGTPVTISGRNFPAGKSFSIILDGTKSSGGTTDSTGNINTTFKIPEVTGPGQKTFQVTADGLSASSVFTVPNAAISISPTEGNIGSSLTLTCQNFPPGGKYNITFGGDILTSGNVDDRGQYKINTTVPSGHKPGSKTVTASVGGFSASANFNISPGSISLAPSVGTVGSSINISGQGFNYTQPVNILLDGRQMGSTTSSSTGSISTSVQIVPSVAGDHNIVAQDNLGNVSPGQSFKVNPGLKSKSSDKVTSGNSIEISGGGFAGSSTVIVTLKGVPSWQQQVQTDLYGSFSLTLNNLPSTAAGKKYLSARDSAGNTSDSDAPLNFTATTKIVGPDSGSYNSPLAIRGTSFPSNESTIAILLGTEQIGVAKSDSNGSYDFTGNVPEIPRGSYDIIARHSQGITNSNSKYTVVSSINAESVSGNVGQQVKFTGKGFDAGNQIKISWDGTEINPDAKVQSDNKGSFIGTFRIPPCKHGSHNWDASDGQNKVQVNWIMESNPPPAPRLNLPVDKAGIGHLWSQTPTFSWYSVEDPSGVVYQLDIASDSGFGHLLISKQNISGILYVLTKSEALRKGDYFWRVKAIDGAENESPWSEVRKMQIGSLLPVYLGVLALVIILCLVVLWYVKIGFTKKQREARKAKQKETREADSTRKTEIKELKARIIELAKSDHNFGRLSMSVITSTLNIDEAKAMICLNELKAKLEDKKYTIPEVHNLYKKK
jgi:hypothetical protein